MSDTAKELRDELRDAWSPNDVVEIVDRAIARIEQLERGIERASTDVHMDGDGDWFLASEVDKYGAVLRVWSSLLKLIEELGNE